MKQNLLDRREFTLASALAVLSGLTITISGCGEDSPGPTPTPGAGISGQVSANHGHTVSISAAELTAGNQITLTFSGTANHTHMVTLTSSEVSQLAMPNHQAVAKTSTTDAGHNHTVTFQ